MCQSPWIAFQGSCYALFTQSSTWNSARDSCRSDSAELVKIESSNENNFIKKNFLASGADYWIGLTDEETEGEWKWSEGSSLTGYTHWDPGQPSDTVHYQNCGGIRHSSAVWHDKPCSEWRGRICKK